MLANINPTKKCTCISEVALKCLNCPNLKSLLEKCPRVAYHLHLGFCNSGRAREVTVTLDIILACERNAFSKLQASFEVLPNLTKIELIWNFKCAPR